MRKNRWIVCLLASFLVFTGLIKAPFASAANSPSHAASSMQPKETEVHAPKELTEPFLVPYLAKVEGDPTPYLKFVMVSPAGKIISGIDIFSGGAITTNFKNGYGYINTYGAYGHSEYAIFDRYANMQKIPVNDTYFYHLDKEWFAYYPDPNDGKIRFYNAVTKKSVIPGFEPGFPDTINNLAWMNVTVDPHHIPFLDGKTNKKGLKELTGKTTCPPFFDEYLGYSEGIHRVKNGSFVVSGLSNNKKFYALMNKKGKVISAKYVYLKPTYDNQFLAVSQKPDGYYLTKINALGKQTLPFSIKLDSKEDFSKISYMGRVFYNDTKILGVDNNRGLFTFPHRLLSITNETVAIEYTQANKTWISVFTHTGKQIYTRQVAR
ncbi:hypothetical protein ACFSO0_09175 [Brevibacillus sp. GCM10020057]|uniref:hypothetical protein n=1 Tax=Brevibacillus sp. GCM10020057 TaxID=3317327 RepID=UPI003627147D